MKKTITHDAAIEELYQGGALGFSRAGAKALVEFLKSIW